ncbi:MAG: HAD hydrolase family protein [Phycisphaerales bacterium]
MSPPGLIITDLDGTLLDSRGRVSARNRAALHAARQAGWHVAIATGRTWAESHHATDAIAEEAFFIGAGGASLHEAGSGRVLATHTLGAPLVCQLAHQIIQHGHRAHLLLDPSVAGHDYLFVGTAELDPATQWWLEAHPISARDWHALPEDAHQHLGDRVLRVGTIGADDDLRALSTTLLDSHGPALTLRQWCALTPDEAIRAKEKTHMLEIFARGVDKWTMATEIAARLGLHHTQTVALGDGLNDLDLVRNAGLGVAMGNADPRIAAVAQQRTATNEEDGVAVAIERLLDGTWSVPGRTLAL